MEVKLCLRRNQRRAARAALVRCEPSTPRRDSKTGELACSSKRRAQPFLLSHCCRDDNRTCLPGLPWNSSWEGATRSMQTAGWARTRNCSRSPNLVTSSAVQPCRSQRGSKAKPTTSSRYSSFRCREKVTESRKVTKSLTAFAEKQCCTHRLTSTFGFGPDSRRGKVPLAFCLHPPTRFGSSMKVVQQASGFSDQAYPDPHCVYVEEFLLVFGGQDRTKCPCGYIPNIRASFLNHYHHSLIFLLNGMRDGVNPLPVSRHMVRK